MLQNNVLNELDVKCKGRWSMAQGHWEDHTGEERKMHSEVCEGELVENPLTSLISATEKLHTDSEKPGSMCTR